MNMNDSFMLLCSPHVLTFSCVGLSASLLIALMWAQVVLLLISACWSSHFIDLTSSIPALILLHCCWSSLATYLWCRLMLSSFTMSTLFDSSRCFVLQSFPSTILLTAALLSWRQLLLIFVMTPIFWFQLLPF